MVVGAITTFVWTRIRSSFGAAGSGGGGGAGVPGAVRCGVPGAMGGCANNPIENKIENDSTAAGARITLVWHMLRTSLQKIHNMRHQSGHRIQRFHGAFRRSW